MDEIKRLENQLALAKSKEAEAKDLISRTIKQLNELKGLSVEQVRADLISKYKKRLEVCLTPLLNSLSVEFSENCFTVHECKGSSYFTLTYNILEFGDFACELAIHHDTRNSLSLDLIYKKSHLVSPKITSRNELHHLVHSIYDGARGEPFFHYEWKWYDDGFDYLDEDLLDCWPKFISLVKKDFDVHYEYVQDELEILQEMKDLFEY